jgi:pimeloyl-ACP methyl ester carboxylesterase
MSPSAAIIATERRPALSPIERVPADADYGAAAEPGWRGFGWSASERDALIAGRRVRYLDVGEGQERAFVLVHGMGGRWQHWLETIPSLAQHGRVLAIDLPGFGRSESPAAPPSLDGFADIAAELARSLGIERVVLIGHSMGGPIAVRFAARHPGLVEAIALVAGAVYQFSDLLGARRVPYWLAARPRETAAIATELLTAGLPAPAALRRLIVRTPALRRMVLSPYVMDPNALPADVISLVVDGAGARGVLPTVAAISRSDAREDMDQVSCPVLSIAGDRDRIVPLADTEALRRDMPAAHSVVLEGCGHMLMLERPEAFNRRLLDFVTTLDEPV